MPGGKKQEPMPQDTWPVTKDDKVVIQALGRKLNEFLEKEVAGKESVHLKIIVGAFNYIMDLQTQRTNLIKDDFVLAKKSVAMAGLTDMVEEPFSPDPVGVEPTVEEKRAYLQEQLALLDQQEMVDGASVAPSDSVPLEVSEADLLPAPKEVEAKIEG